MIKYGKIKFENILIHPQNRMFLKIPPEDCQVLAVVLVVVEIRTTNDSSKIPGALVTSYKKKKFGEGRRRSSLNSSTDILIDNDDNDIPICRKAV